jgi:hypothetical protein
MPKLYSSKKELKSKTLKFAEKHKFSYEDIERLLIEVDRLKSSGNLSDGEILVAAFRKNMTKERLY